MRSCLWRPSRLRQAVWPLAVAMSVFLLITLPSFIKEPNTKPTRAQNRENIRERCSKLLQEAPPPTPTVDRRTPAHGGSAPENSTLAARPRVTGHPEAREPHTARTALLRTQERADTTADTPSQRSQARGRTPKGTEALSSKRQDVRTTKGERGKNEKPTAAGTAPAKPRAPTARTTVLGRQAEALTAGGPGLSPRKTTEGVTTAAAPPKQRAPAPPSSVPSRGPTAQTGPWLRAANFKSEPKWDLEENYSLDAGSLQTTCPDSVKVRASKSRWLQNLFLPNLTLFLDSRRFNRSEWDRLEHFVPPFGFMELNYSLVQKVVTRFPPVAQQQLLLARLPAGSTQCITCAVVGNGGILNNSHVGHEIDSHDYVFRLSGAVIKGYEQDVGTRTSFYGFTAFSLTQSLYALGRRGFPHVPLGKDIHYLHFLEGTRDYDWLETLLLNQTFVKKSLFWYRSRPQEAFRDTMRLDQYLLLHPDAIRYMKNRFLRSKTLDTVHWRLYRPTTGALLLLTALQLCDKVSAYGFITEGHERFSDHYYDTSWKKTVFYINHDFNLERMLWKRLHDEGIIRLYQRPITSNQKSDWGPSKAPTRLPASPGL
ncbi:alpha-N-acetylgalactosaminide alpha-2,6-sialyltransferase 1 [Pteronotus mesoamericanus]|uniref:alpha-N-acetylgalactosaminide alpha-2,6-sialyltransferase 1 n=1 Tax=Pteronotus mesoamericanus TaxID=1884717 RepID=UPI0023EB567A|nr:alpha-N-acetylgalactosaminide alpha-2,6-sialyltransferase 1 [Pteronotus parnellii mesoamericanus]